MKRIEQDIFITADGVSYPLNGSNAAVVAEEGHGMADLDIVTQRATFQHGETYRDYFLKPRTVQYVIRRNFCSRDEYWAGRDRALDVFRPNRYTTPALAVLRKIRSDGQKRDLNVVVIESPKFNQVEHRGWEEWSYHETMRFFAPDPTYFDPAQQHVTLTLDADELVFPITFPITFGPTYSDTIVYTGTWISYPNIVITGPIVNPGIINNTTGYYISINYNLPAGQSIVITLTSTRKVVQLNDGTDLIGYVTTGSNLAYFGLIPGNNSVTIQGTGYTAATKFDVYYYRRFIGL